MSDLSEYECNRLAERVRRTRNARAICVALATILVSISAIAALASVAGR